MSFTVTTRVPTANLRGAASAQPRQPAPTPPRRHLPTRPPPRRSEAKPHWVQQRARPTACECREPCHLYDPRVSQFCVVLPGLRVVATRRDVQVRDTSM